MRLAAADGADRLGRHRRRGCSVRRRDACSPRAEHVVWRRRRRCRLPSDAEQRMAVRRDLLHRQRDLLGAAGLGEDEAVALVDRDPAAQVGQREGRLPVAAVGRADQLEQRLVLGDRQQLALAEHPAGRGEVAGEHPDLTDIGLCHRLRLLSSATGRCPAGRCRSSASGTAACSGAPGCRRRCATVAGAIAARFAGRRTRRACVVDRRRAGCRSALLRRAVGAGRR